MRVVFLALDEVLAMHADLIERYGGHPGIRDVGLLESALAAPAATFGGTSFLGVGTGQAHPTWGQMIALGRDFVSVAWWLPTFPGLAILLTVLAINMVGDRLRDALDTRVGS